MSALKSLSVWVCRSSSGRLNTAPTHFSGEALRVSHSYLLVTEALSFRGKEKRLLHSEILINLAIKHQGTVGMFSKDKNEP